MDLLIVNDTDQRPVERRMAVERLLSDRAVSLDLVVHTPAELRALYAAGEPFVEEVMESGRVLYMRPRSRHGEPTAEDGARAVRVAGEVLGRIRAEIEAASEGEGEGR